MPSETFEFDSENERIGVLLPGKMPLVITRNDLDVSYFSGGPGGQNVNRHMNGVRLIYRIPNSHMLTFKKTKTLTVKCIKQRSMEQNFRSALAEMAERIADYFYIQRPRKKTMTPKRSRKKRLENKKIRAGVKTQRKKVDF